MGNAFTAELGSLSWSSGTHMAEGDNQVTQIVL